MKKTKEEDEDEHATVRFIDRINYEINVVKDLGVKLISIALLDVELSEEDKAYEKALRERAMSIVSLGTETNKAKATQAHLEVKKNIAIELMNAGRDVQIKIIEADKDAKIDIKKQEDVTITKKAEHQKNVRFMVEAQNAVTTAAKADSFSFSTNDTLNAVFGNVMAKEFAAEETADQKPDGENNSNKNQNQKKEEEMNSTLANYIVLAVLVIIIAFFVYTTYRSVRITLNPIQRFRKIKRSFRAQIEALKKKYEEKKEEDDDIKKKIVKTNRKKYAKLAIAFTIAVAIMLFVYPLLSSFLSGFFDGIPSWIFTAILVLIILLIIASKRKKYGFRLPKLGVVEASAPAADKDKKGKEKKSSLTLLGNSLTKLFGGLLVIAMVTAVIFAIIKFIKYDPAKTNRPFSTTERFPARTENPKLYEEDIVSGKEMIMKKGEAYDIWYDESDIAFDLVDTDKAFIEFKTADPAVIQGRMDLELTKQGRSTKVDLLSPIPKKRVPSWWSMTPDRDIHIVVTKVKK